MSYNPFTLEGKTILITGASSGIGRAAAIACSKMGARIILSARNMEALEVTKSLLDEVNIGMQHIILPADLLVDADIKGLASACPEIDGLVSNAGVMKLTLSRFISEQEIDRIYRTNLIAPMILIKEILRKKKLKKSSSIVFTSSAAGIFRVSIGNGIYASSKSGLDAFMRTLALELAPQGIRCNSVNPGMVETDLIKSSFLSEEDLEKEKKRYPLGRFANTDDIVGGIIYLLSDAAKFMTGTTLKIDGGMTLG